MAKTGKRRLKRQVRKTLGALFMASAIIVAAIPVQENEAATPEGIAAGLKTYPMTASQDVHVINYGGTLGSNADSDYPTIQTGNEAEETYWRSAVPTIATDATVYVDDTRNFQFAVVNENATSSTPVAVLLGVERGAVDKNGNLNIPATVDAYKQYTLTTTSGSYSYCAVNKSGTFLYYATPAQKKDAAGNLIFNVELPKTESRTIDLIGVGTKSYEVLVSGALSTSDYESKEVASNSPYMTQLQNGSWVYERDFYTGVPYDVFKQDASGKIITDEFDNPIVDHQALVTEKYEANAAPVMVNSYRPCYIENKDVWSEIELDPTGELYCAASGKTDADVVLNATTPSDANLQPVTQASDDAIKRIREQELAYIGMQKVEATTTGGIITYTVTNLATNSSGKLSHWDYGVFAGKTNLVSISGGENLAGVGDCAFYGCSALQKVSFSNQLNTIGNYAFTGCNNLTSVDMNIHSNLKIIGANAFEGCTNLTSIQIPASVKAIGNECFKNCATDQKGIKYIYLCGEEEAEAPNMSLNRIGYDAFYGCRFLDHLTFPDSMNKITPTSNNTQIPITYFRGCSNLKYIKSNSKDFDVVDNTGDHGITDKPSHNDTDCDIDVWRALLNNAETFYFEGYDSYDLHLTAQVHSAAYHFDDPGKETWYEIVQYCTEATPHKAVYVVNTSNELVDMQVDAACKVMDLPSSVGGYGLTAIGEEAFANQCNLVEVMIPYSIEKIGARAFQGCHKLKYVVFKPNVDGFYNQNLFVDQDAFDTQNFKGGVHYCGESSWSASGTPFLSFTGDVAPGYGPFQYAMNAGNNINVGNQTANTYITYYSPWPSNLTIKYNYVDQTNELIDYPQYNELQTYTAFDLNAVDPTGNLPGITASGASQATSAKSTFIDYEKYQRGEILTPVDITQPQLDIVNSALNIVIPPGVTAIKDGLFSGKKPDGTTTTDYEARGAGRTATAKPDADIRSVVTNTVKDIEAYAFSDMANLSGFYMDGGESIGDYSFEKDDQLVNVEIAASVNKIGTRPFKHCAVETAPDYKLLTVNFKESPYFTCDNAIIYGLDNGSKASIVECLESRGYRSAGGSSSNGTSTITAQELTSVKEIYPEAFDDCDNIYQIDLSQSGGLKTIPELCFANSDKLNTVKLPSSVTRVSNNAFVNMEALIYTEIPSPYAIISPYAFANSASIDCDTKAGGETPTDYDTTPHQDVQVWCEVNPDGDSAVVDYAGNYVYLIPVTEKQVQKWNVYYYDGYNMAAPVLLGKEEVEDGKDGTLPTAPDHTDIGKTFDYWTTNYQAVHSDESVYAMYRDTKHTVKFVDRDPVTQVETILETQTVDDHGTAINPKIPTKEGYTFNGWSVPYTDITEDTICYAIWMKNGDATHKVVFLDWDDTVLSTQEIRDGQDATTPASPTREGYDFTGWDRSYTNVTKDLEVRAMYQKKDSDDTKHTVTFYNYDDTVVSVQKVADGASAVEPVHPTRSGYKFVGWRPTTWTNVTKDLDVYAYFEKSSGSGDDEGDPTEEDISGNKKKEVDGDGIIINYIISDNDNKNNNNNNNSISQNSISQNSAGKYTVTVSGGSGSGTYNPGAVVNINAYATSNGTAFDKWTTPNAGVGFVSATSPATSFIMPAANVAVSATYKNGTIVSGNAIISGNNSSKRYNGGTEVDLNNTGFSNPNLASARVNGSDSNFVVKVTEDAEATAYAKQALQSHFGDMTNIMYLPMDISLYDATGTTKITDTTGLTVDITLPLPDELIPYAGNNMVASCSDGRLDNLPTKFTTIDGVPCVSFTATHFSPYVVYVDTANLTAATISDATPKTGDGIHPKWFLAIGLACVSVILFFKRDKRVVAKTA